MGEADGIVNGGTEKSDAGRGDSIAMFAAGFVGSTILFWRGESLARANDRLGLSALDFDPTCRIGIWVWEGTMEIVNADWSYGAQKRKAIGACRRPTKEEMTRVTAGLRPWPEDDEK